MDDASAVRFRHCRTQLFHDIHCLFIDKRTTGTDNLFEGFSGNIFHDDVMVILIFTNIIDFYNIRMRQ